LLLTDTPKSTEYEFILTEKKDKVALITLNRPKVTD
jgi:enoyl-CoA hydratase/carnithine racemase